MAKEPGYSPPPLKLSKPVAPPLPRAEEPIEVPLVLETRHDFLRLFSVLLLLIAVLVVLAGFGVAAGVDGGARNDAQRILILGAYVAAAIGILAIPALIHLGLAIEENTRATRMLLEKLRK